MKKNVKVLLLGHGSSLPFAKKNFQNLKKILATDYPTYIIDLAFMTEGKDALNEKIFSDLTEFIEKIIVVPVFLSHGVHTKKDIPKMLELDSENIRMIDFQGRIIKLVYTEPLGIDSRISDIVKDRIQDAISL